MNQKDSELNVLIRMKNMRNPYEITEQPHPLRMRRCFFPFPDLNITMFIGQGEGYGSISRKIMEGERSKNQGLQVITRKLANLQSKYEKKSTVWKASFLSQRTYFLGSTKYNWKTGSCPLFLAYPPKQTL